MTPREPLTWEDALDESWRRFRAVMVNRHRKYGGGNISRFGETGVIVRLSDKIERLITMLDRASDAPDFPDDSVDDAYTDVGNYGVIGYMVRRGWWTLPADCLGQVPEPTPVIRADPVCDWCFGGFAVPFKGTEPVRICRHCGGTFCDPHLEPENHDCENENDA